MNEKYIKFKYLLLCNLKKLWSEYKVYVLLLSVFFLIGFITGILTCSGFSKDLSCDNIINIYLLDFLKRDLNWLSLFLILSIFFVLLIVLSTIFIRNKTMIVITTLIFMIFLYIWGFDLYVMIVCLGIAGIIFGILFYGVIGIFVFFLYAIFLAIIFKAVITKRINDKQFVSVKFKMCFLFCILTVILIFFMVFFFSVIHIFIIVE